MRRDDTSSKGCSRRRLRIRRPGHQAPANAVTFERPAHLLAAEMPKNGDVWMPETNGLEVQARLSEVSPGTKVIVMTARETPTIRTAALEAGAFAFVIKPFDDEAFLSLVRQALRGVAGR